MFESINKKTILNAGQIIGLKGPVLDEWFNTAIHPMKSF
jgi:hypothetical protein